MVIHGWLVTELSHKTGDLNRVVLEHGPQLEQRAWQKDEARTTEQKNSVRDNDISKDQFLGEGDYADVQGQSMYD